MRDINDILYFRGDISPFLVHLTRAHAGRSARENLEQIINDKRLVAGDIGISDARFGINTMNMLEEDRRRYFGAISFTETPLGEIHTFLEIRGRAIDLCPYGLVFLKEKAMRRGVSPVFYINNIQRDKDAAVRALCSLIEANADAAAQILLLVAVFGNIFQPPGAAIRNRNVDFKWEREWRFPSIQGDFNFATRDVFIGLCPHEEIADFEVLFPRVKFIDPTRNMKWYAGKLIDARQRCDLKFSVV